MTYIKQVNAYLYMVADTHNASEPRSTYLPVATWFKTNLLEHGINLCQRGYVLRNGMMPF
jgi:hypothetical protein